MIPLHRKQWVRIEWPINITWLQSQHKLAPKALCVLPTSLLQSISRPCRLTVLQTWRSGCVSSSPAGPWHLADDIILTGPAGAQVFPVDGFDRQCDRGSHDTHIAVPVSPQTSLGPPHSEGPADRCWNIESRGRLQCVWCDLFSEKTGGGTVGGEDGWMER